MGLPGSSLFACLHSYLRERVLFMLREFFVRPRTGKIDWWLIALTLVSVLSIVGAMMEMYPVVTR